MSRVETSLGREIEDVIARHGMDGCLSDEFFEALDKALDEEYERHRAPQRERLQHQARALWATGELRKRGIAEVEVEAKSNDSSLWFEVTKTADGELEYFVRRAEAWEVIGLVLWLEGRGYVRLVQTANGSQRVSTLEARVRLPSGREG